MYSNPVLPAFQGDRSYKTTFRLSRVRYGHFPPLSFHNNDLSTFVGRDTREVASEKLDVSTATTDLGASGQEDGLIMHGRQHVYRLQGDGESLDREKLEDGGEDGAGRDAVRGSCRRVCNQ